jgi:hypothetical protein
VELFLSIQNEQGYVIRQKLLEALGNERENPVRNKIGDAVAEIARQYSDSSTHMLTAVVNSRAELILGRDSMG